MTAAPTALGCKAAFESCAVDDDCCGSSFDILCFGGHCYPTPDGASVNGCKYEGQRCYTNEGCCRPGQPRGFLCKDNYCRLPALPPGQGEMMLRPGDYCNHYPAYDYCAGHCVPETNYCFVSPGEGYYNPYPPVQYKYWFPGAIAVSTGQRCISTHDCFLPMLCRCGACELPT